MLKETTAIGKDINEAQENARAALGAGPLDDVKYEILDMGSRGFLGFMARPAKVKATLEVADIQEARRPKHDRPRKERDEQTKTAASEEVKDAAKSEAPAAAKPRKKKNHKKNNENRKPHSNNAEAVTSTAIPEAELKMERREVATGEDMSFDFVSTVLTDIGLNATAELYSCEDGTRRITIVGEDASALIGHHGDTLDALQYLANLASARKNVNGERDKSRVTLDIEGYRAKREETLRALARRMAAKALKNRRSVMLEPMTPYERRIIHSEIQGIEGVSTNSVGSDGNRKIVIFLTDKKPKGIFEEEKPTTSLKTEFAQDSEDLTSTIAAVEPIVTSDDEAETETVTLEQTHPAGDYTADAEEEDIK